MSDCEALHVFSLVWVADKADGANALDHGKEESSRSSSVTRVSSIQHPSGIILTREKSTPGSTTVPTPIHVQTADKADDDGSPTPMTTKATTRKPVPELPNALPIHSRVIYSFVHFSG